MKFSYSIVSYIYLNLSEESLFHRYVDGWYRAHPVILLLNGKPNSS